MRKIAILGVNTGIGNVLMGEPLARKIKLNCPNSEITFIVSNNQCMTVLENNHFIDKIVVVPRGKSRLEDFFPFKGFNILRKLRKEELNETYIITPHTIYQNVCSRIIGANKRVAHDEGLFNFLNTLLIKLEKKHEILNNLNLFAGQNPKIKPKIFLNKTIKTKTDKKLVGIHPGCDKKSYFRRWPIENFIEFAKRIKNRGYEPIFFLGPDEKEFIEKIKCKNLEYFMSSMKETIQKISECSYFVSNDSGLSHIAEALGVPLLTLFGPSDYKRSGVIPDKKTIVITPKNYKPWSYTLDEINNEKNAKKTGNNSTEEISVERVEENFKRLENVRNKRI